MSSEVTQRTRRKSYEKIKPKLYKSHKTTMKALIDYVLKNRQLPSYRELAKFMSRSDNFSNARLSLLRKRKFVKAIDSDRVKLGSVQCPTKKGIAWLESQGVSYKGVVF